MPIRGDRLDKPSYAILRSMRGGNTGDAWLTHHEVFGQRIVQKTYSTIGLEDSVAATEPRLLRNIDHRHVATVFEAQFDPDYEHAITFTMPYYEGRCVATAFDEGYVFSSHQAIKLATHVLDALAHVHTVHRYIHRDPKPGNVFLDADRETAFLGDFGSAAEMDGRGRVAGILGSPLYMPPEGGPEDGEVGVTGDIFGVGVTLFEMLNGPFAYADISPEDVERRLARGRRALSDSAFDTWDPSVSERLKTAVRKAIRTAPAQRYASALEFKRAIEHVPCIDWKRVEGSELDGTWEGSWPPQLRPDRRRRYRVTSRILRGSRRRLEAFEALPGSSRRRFAVPDATVEPEDRRAVDRFFSEVATRAAQRMPAH